MTTPQLTADQEREMRRLKQYFPYRIVFGVIKADTGEFEVHANPTRRRANNFARQGHHVFILNY